jgi:hypothetical protein
MADPRRDGLLAAAALAAVVASGSWLAGPAPFLRPAVVAAGIAAALAAEWCFLVSPTLAAGWERRGVPVASAVALAGFAVLLGSRVAWLLGVAAWGLVTYGALLGWVLLGGTNPVARLTGEGGDGG